MLFARNNRETIEYMTVGVCVNFMKKSFSQTVSEPEFLLSTYNISTEQSKDDYHLVTAGDYVLNTLLVALWLCLFVILSVSRLTQKRLAPNF